jgi:hypothetical protein
MTGWTIRDESSKVYLFPDFILNNASTVTIYTGCGTNSDTELYWCNSGQQCNAIWNNDDDTFILRNENNTLILTYTYG